MKESDSERDMVSDVTGPRPDHFSWLLEHVCALYPAPLAEEFRVAWPDILLTLERLALEVMQVETRGVPYAQALRVSGMSFPLMTRIHYGIADVIQFELKPELRSAIRHVLRAVRQNPDLAEIPKTALRCVHDHGSRREAALLRFLLYETLLLDMRIACWDRPEVEATGAFYKLEWDAQEIVTGWLAAADEAPDVRLSRGMLAEGMLRVSERLREQSAFFSREHIETIIAEVIPAISCARELPAADAVIVRNAYAERVGEECLGSQRLADRHPLLFTSAGNVDVRRHRLPGKISSSTGLQRRKSRLIDELLSTESEEPQ